MGGYFSGRRNGGPVVEDGLKLELADCIRKGLIRPGSYVAGTIQWTLTRTGEVTANISYVANLVDPADAWVRLIYTSTTRASGAKVDNDYRVRLEATRPNFGGLRWWFLCPVTGRQRDAERGVDDEPARHRLIDCGVDDIGIGRHAPGHVKCTG